MVMLRFWLCVGLLALAGSVFFTRVVPSLRVETDLLDLLPQRQSESHLDAALEEFSAAFSHKILFLVGARERTAAGEGAVAFARVLETSRAFTNVRATLSGDVRAAADLYLEHRFHLLPESVRVALANGQAARVERAALQSLFTPVGFAKPFGVARDPLGLGSTYLLEQAPSWGAARLDGAQLVVRGQSEGDRNWYVLVPAEVVGSPFAVDVQEHALAAIRDASAAAGKAAGADVSLLSSGTLPHAAAATAAARQEVQVFSTIGTVFVLAMLLSLFRSWRAPALGVLALAAGACVGISVTHFVFGELHLVALVFGSSLIGVAIDYSMHYFSDQFRQEGAWNVDSTLAHVSRPIVLGLAATLLGFLGLLVLPFPGLQQMAAISLAGLPVACGCVLCLYPVLGDRRAARLPAWCARLLDFLERVTRQRQSRRTAIVMAMGLLLLVILGGTRIQFQDDIRQLQPRFGDLAQQERTVRELLRSSTESALFVVSGADADTVLRNEERLTAVLDRLVREEALLNYVAVSRSLPSVEKQRESLSLLARSVYAPDGVLPSVMRTAGFEESAIDAQLADFARGHNPLLPAEWLEHPASVSLRSLWLGARDGQYATVVTLGGIRDIDALQRIDGTLPGVQFVDRVRDISRTLQTYREAVLGVLAAAYVILLVALAIRYGLRDAWRMLLPPVGAAAITLATLGWVGVPVTLFTAIALLLLLGMGVDYAIFLREAREQRRTALLAVTLSAVTTAFSFGLLAWSSTPLIQAIGVALGVGIVACWLLAVMSDPVVDPVEAK
jgi:predicted exporter